MIDYIGDSLIIFIDSKVLLKLEYVYIEETEYMLLINDQETVKLVDLNDSIVRFIVPYMITDEDFNNLFNFCNWLCLEKAMHHVLTYYDYQKLNDRDRFFLSYLRDWLCVVGKPKDSVIEAYLPLANEEEIQQIKKHLKEQLHIFKRDLKISKIPPVKQEEIQNLNQKIDKIKYVGKLLKTLIKC